MYKLMNNDEFNSYMVTKYKNHLNIRIIKNIGKSKDAEYDTFLVVDKGNLIVAVDDSLLKLEQGDIIEIPRFSHYQLFSKGTSIVYQYRKGHLSNSKFNKKNSTK
ncbi:hypothetical protein EZV73_03270 [Acidaminobacter sp. JC074]|uniref:hypothetical protein n=1 Tax=Acidaminobacter sp. JC074 TaxID=2530199 RepID=UPI001F0DA036|nr:hypothetical protein [Acidaminobacter sp. JC074]MCH4886570.1 hypothetical protein [Acidaminobacter sp. JC074]